MKERPLCCSYSARAKQTTRPSNWGFCHHNLHWLRYWCHLRAIPSPLPNVGVYWQIPSTFTHSHCLFPTHCLTPCLPTWTWHWTVFKTLVYITVLPDKRMHEKLVSLLEYHLESPGQIFVGDLGTCNCPPPPYGHNPTQTNFERNKMSSSTVCLLV